MGEPFRDEMSAALTRAEKLAEENQDLKRELELLRETAHRVRAEEPDHPLATQTLAVLERLEAATRVEPAPLAKKEEHVDMSQLADLPPKPKASGAAKALPPLPPPPRSGVRVGTLLVACFICLAIGIVLGAMTR